MLKVFHAYPTYGLSDEEIKYNIRKEHYTFMPLLTMEFDVSPSEIELADTNMKDSSMFGLGSQIIQMSKCDVIILGHIEMIEFYIKNRFRPGDKQGWIYHQNNT